MEYMPSLKTVMVVEKKCSKASRTINNLPATFDYKINMQNADQMLHVYL